MKKNNLEQILENYLSDLSGIKRLSNHTLTAYKKDISQFVDFLENQKIKDITKVNERIVRKYIVELNEKNLTKTSISRKLSVLRNFFNFLIQHEIIEVDPLGEIKNPKITRKLPEIITLDSFEKILKLLEEENKSNTHHKLIFELLYGCALRVSEVCNLKFGDIDLNRKSIRVLGKGNKTRIVPLGSKSERIYKEYIAAQNQSNLKDSLIVTNTGKPIYSKYVDRLVKKYLNKVSDVSKKSPHIFRHTAATHMLDNGADLMGVKEILGHENLSTTQIYTHVSVERLKKAYKNAHPKS